MGRRSLVRDPLSCVPGLLRDLGSGDVSGWLRHALELRLRSANRGVRRRVGAAQVVGLGRPCRRGAGWLEPRWTSRVRVPLLGGLRGLIVGRDDVGGWRVPGPALGDVGRRRGEPGPKQGSVVLGPRTGRGRRARAASARSWAGQLSHSANTSLLSFAAASADRTVGAGMPFVASAGGTRSHRLAGPGSRIALGSLLPFRAV